MTAGQSPETIMLGSTADISCICKFGWYNWIMFCNNVPTYPDDKMMLGQYLGPAIDVRSALTMKILKSNGQVVCRLTVRHLTDEERKDDVHLRMGRSFDLAISESHGIAATAADFPTDELTPEYKDYEIGLANPGPDKTDTETPETGDNLLNAEVKIHCGGILTKARVTSRKQDINGNPIGCANPNPVLDI
jgi:hypothetical protein